MVNFKLQISHFKIGSAFGNQQSTFGEESVSGQGEGAPAVHCNLQEPCHSQELAGASGRLVDSNIGRYRFGLKMLDRNESSFAILDGTEAPGDEARPGGTPDVGSSAVDCVPRFSH